MADQNPLLTGAPTWADAYSYNANALSNWVQQQRQISADRGLWNDQTGLPTGAGLVSAAQQTGNALLAGTTAPRGLDPRLFVPALRMTMEGRPTVFAGKPGELHEDLIDRLTGTNAGAHAYDNATGHDLGFVNSATGRYYTREQAANAIGVSEASELIPPETLRAIGRNPR